MPLKLIHSKRGSKFFANISVVNVIAVIFLSLIVIFIINFLLNQLFGLAILKLGQPLRFAIVGISLIAVFWVIINNRASLDRTDFFTIAILAVGSGLLFYYLPVFVPEIFSSFPLLQSAYSNSNSPIFIWNNATSSVVNAVQAVIP